jgi:hypothetical protein
MDKEAVQITLDPYLETADVDMSNNFYPPKTQLSRYEIFKGAPSPFGAPGENPMQKAKRIQQRSSGSN